MRYAFDRRLIAVNYGRVLNAFACIAKCRAKLVGIQNDCTAPSISVHELILSAIDCKISLELAILYGRRNPPKLTFTLNERVTINERTSLNQRTNLCGIFAKYCMYVHECFVFTLVYFCI